MTEQTRAPRNRATWLSLGTAVLVLLIAALAGWLGNRHAIEADWTRAGLHTLSDTSVQVLSRFTGPIAVDAYAGKDPELRNAISRFVARYQRARPDISLRFIDPDAFPDEARQLDISVNGELVLRYEGRIERVQHDSEEEFTNALLRLLRNSERWLAFVEGHGERDALGERNHDLGELARLLKQRGYNFRPINLGETAAIPDNTSVLVIAGPRAPFLAGEQQLVLDFIERGGSLLWLVDEGAVAGLSELAASLHVDILPGLVIDYQSAQLAGLQDPTIALITAGRYGKHPALEGFALTSLLPTAGALRLAAGSSWQATPLLLTGDATWLEVGELQGEVRFNEGVDVVGPLIAGVALERPAPGAGDAAAGTQHVVVVADGDFLSNAYVANNGNLELAYRLFNWLSHDEGLISIPSRTAGDTQLEMDNVTVGILALVYIFLLPGLLALAGAWIWWRRRRL